MKYAVDIGCGSGQSSRGLLHYFDTVKGIDVSEAQISKAPTDITQLSFQVGSAEDLSSFGSQSIDLVTLAQAIHWVDLEKFYPEVHRVLSPKGVLAIYGYGNVELDNTEASALVRKVNIISNHYYHFNISLAASGIETIQIFSKL